MGERNRTKIKICGLTRACDIDFVNEALPDYIGFVFAKSRRRVEITQAAALKKRLNKSITAVGVFVDAAEEEILRLLEEGIIDAVQLHGAETPESVRRLKERAGCPVIKAVRPEEGQFPAEFYRRYEDAGLDGFLFDSGKAPVQPVSAGKERAGNGNAEKGNADYGGTGRTFDWGLLPETGLPCFLAGGLDGENILRAIERTRPFGVDVSSGVETDGLKDREKILEIVKKVRAGYGA